MSTSNINRGARLVECACRLTSRCSLPLARLPQMTRWPSQPSSGMPAPQAWAAEFPVDSQRWPHYSLASALIRAVPREHYIQS
jgi:hypothetical protein